MVMSDAQLRDGGLARERLLRAQQLLEEALRLIDGNANAPEIGARLDDLIQELKSQMH